MEFRKSNNSSLARQIDTIAFMMPVIFDFRVVTALDFIVNKTNELADDTHTFIDTFILGTIHDRRNQLKKNFKFKDVRFGKNVLKIASVVIINLLFCIKVEKDEFSSPVDSKKTPLSVKLIVGVATGCLALVVLAAVVVGIAVHSRRRGRKNYEALPLLTEE